MAVDLLNELTVPIIVIASDYTIVYANKRFHSVMDVGRTNFAGKNLWRLFDIHKYSRLETAFRQAFESGKFVSSEIESRELGATFDLRVTPCEGHIVVEFVDITKFKARTLELENQIQFYTDNMQSVFGVATEATHSAHTDLLTNVLNRRGVDEIASGIFRGAQQIGIPYSILLLDIDHFKSVNDRYGHAEGDRVLRAVAQCLQSTANESETVARFGGEEFLVLCPRLGTLAARQRATQFLDAVRELTEVPRPITASIGVASMSDLDSAWTEIVDRADRAMYLAKNRGRDQVASWTEDRELSPHMQLAA